MEHHPHANQRTENCKPGKVRISTAQLGVLSVLRYSMVVPVSENNAFYKSHIQEEINNHLQIIKNVYSYRDLSTCCYVSLVESCQWLSEGERNGYNRYIVSVFSSS